MHLNPTVHYCLSLLCTFLAHQRTVGAWVTDHPTETSIVDLVSPPICLYLSPRRHRKYRLVAIFHRWKECSSMDRCCEEVVTVLDQWTARLQLGYRSIPWMVEQKAVVAARKAQRARKTAVGLVEVEVAVAGRRLTCWRAGWEVRPVVGEAERHRVWMGGSERTREAVVEVVPRVMWFGRHCVQLARQDWVLSESRWAEVAEVRSERWEAEVVFGLKPGLEAVVVRLKVAVEVLQEGRGGQGRLMKASVRLEAVLEVSCRLVEAVSAC